MPRTFNNTDFRENIKIPSEGELDEARKIFDSNPTLRIIHAYAKTTNAAPITYRLNINGAEQSIQLKHDFTCYSRASSRTQERRFWITAIDSNTRLPLLEHENDKADSDFAAHYYEAFVREKAQDATYDRTNSYALTLYSHQVEQQFPYTYYRLKLPNQLETIVAVAPDTPLIASVFGTITFGYSAQNGPVAIKTAHASALMQGQAEHLQSEATAASACGFTLGWHDIMLTQPELGALPITAPYHFFSALEQGDLRSILYLTEQKLQSDPSFCAEMSLGIITHLVYLFFQDLHRIHTTQHEEHAGWIHGDVKPENFFCSITPKIKGRHGDFGLALKLPSSDATITLQHRRGTPGYMAPEIPSMKQFSTASDAYAAGITLEEVFSHIEKGDSYSQTHKNLVRFFRPLAMRMISPVPAKRPSMAIAMIVIAYCHHLITEQYPHLQYESLPTEHLKILSPSGQHQVAEYIQGSARHQSLNPLFINTLIEVDQINCSETQKAQLFQTIASLLKKLIFSSSLDTTAAEMLYHLAKQTATSTGPTQNDLIENFSAIAIKIYSNRQAANIMKKLMEHHLAPPIPISLLLDPTTQELINNILVHLNEDNTRTPTGSQFRFAAPMRPLAVDDTQKKAVIKKIVMDHFQTGKAPFLASSLIALQKMIEDIQYPPKKETPSLTCC